MKVFPCALPVLWLGLLLPITAPSLPGPPVSLEQDELTGLRGELLAALEEVAALCQKSKLYLQRNNVYEQILIVDTDHAAARKALGYKRISGDWKRDKYRPPSDRGAKSKLVEIAAFRAQKAQALGERLAPLLATASEEEKLREVRFYFLLDREDDGLNTILGRVKDAQGRWRDADELEQELRQAELRGAADSALANKPTLESWTVEEPVSAAPLTWTAGYRTDRVRLAGTGTEAEITRAAEVAHALGELLTTLLPPPGPLMEGKGRAKRPAFNIDPMHGKFIVYLLTGPGQLPALLEAFPDLTEEQRELFSQLSTSFLNEENSIGVWVGNETERLDAMTRQLIGAYLRDEYRLSTVHGWAWEGLGIYLTHLLIGTRMTFFVKPSDYVVKTDPKLDARLLEPDSDWIYELRKSIEDGRPPQLGLVVGKDVNSLELRELLLVHGLAAFLIELHAEKLPNILRRMGAGTTSIAALEQEFGKTIPQLQEELYAWVIEASPPPEAETEESTLDSTAAR